MLSSGTILGNYEIVARIRSGGMASLYIARRKGAAGFVRPVAIKVIHPHLADDPSFVKMFVDEARLSAKILDPHVVHIEELGQEGDTFFLVMEYVHGCSLSELLKTLARKSIRMTPELATQIAIQVADGLHAAHEAVDENGTALGVVHRDVSPQNVLLAYRGHVKLIDFGVAKVRDHSRKTATGSIRGKICYMPPEQAYGREVDCRADVYALGIVLWEMLTMRRMFDGSSELAVLERVRVPDPRPPSELSPGIPPALDAAVMAALSPSPEGRPASANEFRRKLAAAMPGALSIDSMEFSKFLSAIMKEEIEAAAKKLPGAVAAAFELVPVNEPETVVKTMTLEAKGLQTLDFADSVPRPVVSDPGPPANPRRRTRWGVAAVLGLFALGGALAMTRALTLLAPAPVGAASVPVTVPLATIAPSPPPPASDPVVTASATATPARQPAKNVPARRTLSVPPTKPSASTEPPRVHLINGVPIADKPTF
ncbi:MAG: protein kinase [Polyangiaceae bacterium]